MNVYLQSHKVHLNSQEFLYVLLSLSISTIFLGYAPSSIALGLFVILSLRYILVVHKPKVKIAKALLLPIALYIVFAISLLWSVDVAQTMTGLGRMLAFLLLPITFVFLPKPSKKAYNVFFSIFNGFNLLYGLLFVFSATIKFIKTPSFNVFTYHELVSVLELNAIYVSIYFLTSFFYLLFKSKHTKVQRLKTLFLFTLIVLLSSKVIIFTTLVGLFFWLIKQPFATKQILIIGTLILILVSLASLRFYKRIKFETETKFSEVFKKEEFGPVYIWTGTSLRLFYLRLLKEQIVEDKILWKGFGLFASKQNIIKRHKKYNTYIDFHKFNYHNQYAQILAENGLFGLLIIFLMLLYLFKSAILLKNYFWFFLALSFTLLFFSESLLWRQRGLFLFVIMYCIIIKASNLDKEKNITLL